MSPAVVRTAMVDALPESQVRVRVRVREVVLTAKVNVLPVVDLMLLLPVLLSSCQRVNRPLWVTRYNFRPHLLESLKCAITGELHDCQDSHGAMRHYR